MPVVSVHTHVSLVVVLAVGAPHSLEVEHVEVHVGLELLNQLHRQLALSVRERAELTVLALRMAIQVRRAELGLVLVWVVELLHTVVRLVAAVLVGAVLVVLYVPALLRLVVAKWPAPVLLVVVVVRALLEVVVLGIVEARLCLEESQVEEGNALGHLDVLSSVITVLFVDLLCQLRLLVRHDPAS